MTPALIAAVKVCIAVMNPHGIIATYPLEYNKCPEIMMERDREADADRRARADDPDYRSIYLRGLRDLPEGKGK